MRSLCDHRGCVSVCLSVCLSACVSQKPQSKFPHILYMLPVTVAGSFSDSNAINYVLPVLWMTSCFSIMHGIGHNQRRRICFVHFARRQTTLFGRGHRWQYRVRSLPSPTVSCLAKNDLDLPRCCLAVRAFHYAFSNSIAFIVHEI